MDCCFKDFLGKGRGFVVGLCDERAVSWIVCNALVVNLVIYLQSYNLTQGLTKEHFGNLNFGTWRRLCIALVPLSARVLLSRYHGQMLGVDFLVNFCGAREVFEAH